MSQLSPFLSVSFWTHRNGFLVVVTHSQRKIQSVTSPSSVPFCALYPGGHSTEGVSLIVECSSLHQLLAADVANILREPFQRTFNWNHAWK